MSEGKSSPLARGAKSRRSVAETDGRETDGVSQFSLCEGGDPKGEGGRIPENTQSGNLTSLPGYAGSSPIAPVLHSLGDGGLATGDTPPKGRIKIGTEKTKMKKVLLIFLLVSQSAFADYITQNIVDGCTNNYIASDNNYHSDMIAEFTPNQHTCAVGEFLPANVDECRACPSGRTCTGGTFNFNENISQGISPSLYFTQSQNNSCVKDFIGIDNNHSDMVADFTPNTHTCSSGYYLPAGVDECTTCPTGGNCSGGTFTFNETTNQGVDSCNTGYYESNGTCVANTITVRWDDGNGGAYSTTCTYGGALTTPTTEPVAPRGYHFTGWTFNLSN